MINKLKPKSEFNRNVLTLITGTTIAQAIPIAITPVLTRIYTPEDFVSCDGSHLNAKSAEKLSALVANVLKVISIDEP